VDDRLAGIDETSARDREGKQRGHSPYANPRGS
jgi:hypothetical protein